LTKHLKQKVLIEIPHFLGVPDIQLDLFNLISSAGKPIVVVDEWGALSVFRVSK